MLINSAFAHLLKLSRACPFASRVSPSFLKGVGPRGCCSLLVQSASHLGGGGIFCLLFQLPAFFNVCMAIGKYAFLMFLALGDLMCLVLGILGVGGPCVAAPSFRKVREVVWVVAACRVTMGTSFSCYSFARLQ